MIEQLIQDGKVAFEKKDFSLALDLFNQAHDLNNENAEIYFWRGKINSEMKNFSEAIKDFEKIVFELHDQSFSSAAKIELDITLALKSLHEDPFALSELGVQYFKDMQETTDLTLVFRLFDLALRENQHNAQALAWRGKVFLMQNDLQQALENFNRAIETPEASQGLLAVAWRGLQAIARMQNDVAMLQKADKELSKYQIFLNSRILQIEGGMLTDFAEAFLACQELLHDPELPLPVLISVTIAQAGYYVTNNNLIDAFARLKAAYHMLSPQTKEAAIRTFSCLNEVSHELVKIFACSGLSVINDDQLGMINNFYNFAKFNAANDEQAFNVLVIWYELLRLKYLPLGMRIDILLDRARVHFAKSNFLAMQQDCHEAMKLLQANAYIRMEEIPALMVMFTRDRQGYSEFENFVCGNYCLITQRESEAEGFFSACASDFFIEVINLIYARHYIQQRDFYAAFSYMQLVNVNLENQASTLPIEIYFPAWMVKALSRLAAAELFNQINFINVFAQENYIKSLCAAIVITPQINQDMLECFFAEPANALLLAEEYSHFKLQRSGICLPQVEAMRSIRIAAKHFSLWKNGPLPDELLIHIASMACDTKSLSVEEREHIAQRSFSFRPA